MHFSIREYGVFREIRKIKLLCVGVHGYVAQVRVPIDAEITEKNRHPDESYCNFFSSWATFFFSLSNSATVTTPMRSQAFLTSSRACSCNFS